MNIQTSPPAPFDHGGGFAAPFRAHDLTAPKFAPAGSGGFAAKYVAIGAIALFFVGAFAFALVGAVNQFGDAWLDRFMPGWLIVCGLVYLLAIGTWIYSSWEFLPPALRRDASGRVFEPASAVLLNVVPLFNLYWMFVQTVGLCDALDAALVQHGKAPSAPRNLALACVIVQLVPVLNWVAGPVMWLTFMFFVDRTKRALVAAP